MKAEAHDRINVQNNPVNMIDPHGLLGWDTVVSFISKKIGSSIGKKIIRMDDGEIVQDFDGTGWTEEAYWEDAKEWRDMENQYERINKWVEEFCQKHPNECKEDDKEDDKGCN